MTPETSAMGGAIRECVALTRGYAATVWGAVALRLRIERPAVGSIEFFRYRRRWNCTAQRGFGFEVRADGPRPEPVRDGTGTLLVANHFGFADLNVIVCETPPEAKLNFVAKREVGEVPIFGWHLKHFGDLLFDRRNPFERADVIVRALDRLAAGFSVGVFPEGTRSRDGRPKPTIAPALIDAAIHARVRIQPVAIAGTGDLIENWRKRHRGHPVFVRFGRARRDYERAADVWADVLQMWADIDAAQRSARAAWSTP